MAPFGHPGCPDRARVAQHHHRLGTHIEIGVVDTVGEVVNVLEHDRAALVLEQSPIGRRCLHHGAVRAEVASQHGQRAALVERIGPRADHAIIDDLARGGVEVLADGLAGDGECVEVQEVANLLEHRRQPARVVEVLHQVIACRLEVDQPRRRHRELVEQR
jgi:hypothetical protein